MALANEEADMTANEEAIEQLHSLRDYVRWGASRFTEAGVHFGHGTDNAVDEALQLVLHALHLAPGLPAELMHGRLTLSERRTVVALLERRIRERLPAAYLTQQAWFAGLPFYVDERVLVPRSPNDELIEQQLPPRVGPAALPVTGINSERHARAGRVHAVESDLFAALAGRRYELIVSNPPYVDAAMLAALF